MPLSGVIDHQRLEIATMNLYVSISKPITRYERRYKMLKMG